MPLPDLDVEKIRRFCAERVPKRVRDEVRLTVKVQGRRVSIHEERPVFKGAPGEWTSMPIAQLRYEGDGLWSLYYGDRNSKWQQYFDLEPHQPIATIINELDEDPTCVFWG